MLDLNRDRDHGPRRRVAKERRPSDLRRMEDLASHLPPPTTTTTTTGPQTKRASPPRAPSHVHWEHSQGSPAPSVGAAVPSAPQHGRRSASGTSAIISPPRRGSVGAGGGGASPGMSTYPPPPNRAYNSQAPSTSVSPMLQFNPSSHPPDSQGPSRISHASPQYSDAAGFQSFPGGERPRSFLAELLATRDALAHEAQRRREVAGAPPAQWSSAYHPHGPHHADSSSAAAGRDDNDDAGPLDFESFSLGPNKRLERLETPADIRVARRRRADVSAASTWAAPSQVPERVPGRTLYKPFNPTAAARGRGDQPAGEASSFLEGAIGGGYGATRRHQLDDLPDVADKIGSAVARDEVDRLLHKFATVSPRGQEKKHFDVNGSSVHASSGVQHGRRGQDLSSTVAVINDSDGTTSSLPPYVRPSRRPPPPPGYGSSAPPRSPPAILNVSSVILRPAASPPTSGRREQRRKPQQAASAEVPVSEREREAASTPPPVSSTPAPVNNDDDAAMFAGEEEVEEGPPEPEQEARPVGDDTEFPEADEARAADELGASTRADNDTTNDADDGAAAPTTADGGAPEGDVPFGDASEEDASAPRNNGGGSATNDADLDARDASPEEADATSGDALATA